jgi:hypothetical protein
MANTNMGRVEIHVGHDLDNTATTTNRSRRLSALHARMQSSGTPFDGRVDDDVRYALEWFQDRQLPRRDWWSSRPGEGADVKHANRVDAGDTTKGTKTIVRRAERECELVAV